MHSWDILGQVHDHESFLPRADPHLHWQGRGPLSGYSFFRVAPLSSCVCLVEIFNSRCTICMRQMLNPWTWWWSIFYEVTRLESHHALLSKFSFLQFLEVILFPIFSHHDQYHLQRILQENSWWWNFNVHPSHLLGALFGINASMSATLSDEPIETRDLGSGAACPCRACAIISIMSRLIWKVGLMRQEDTRLFGFVDWLGRMMSEKVDTLIYAVFNSKSYIFCAYKYYVLLGRTFRSFWLLCSPSNCQPFASTCYNWPIPFVHGPVPSHAWNLFERLISLTFTLNHWSHFPKLLLEFLEAINPDTRWYDCAEGLRRVLEAVFEKSPAAEWQLGWKVRKGWSNFATEAKEEFLILS